MGKYSIGVDFGTLSARAVLINLETKEELATSVYEYPNKILEKSFKGQPLDNSYAFQNPNDYTKALSHTIKSILKETKISPLEVIGLGIDFTSCTVLPTKSDGTPLCNLKEYENKIFSYAKLWKHHGGEKEAEYMTKIAQETKQPWLEKYGGKISSEWLFPKIAETLNKSPQIFESADCFIEAGDWISWQITGKKAHSSCMAGYKAMYVEEDGFPKKEFFKKIDKRLENIIGTKISDNVVTVGEKLGEINAYGSKLTGLDVGTAVAVPVIDAHSTLFACGVAHENVLMLIVGTSGVHIVLSKDEKSINGLCGIVKDGIVPGYYAYEAGQSCLGDNFSWFIENCVPKKYYDEAQILNMNIYDFMEEKASKCNNFESMLVCTDWFNGNRTPYSDYTLSASVSGLTLKTKPEEFYRAVIEGTAFGTKAIIDIYEKGGIKINEIVAAGGIAEKSELIMQIYADVTGKTIKISGSPQAGALGSAILGAVAGGYFKNVEKATDSLKKLKEKIYIPNKENNKKYEKLYRKYCDLAIKTK